MTVPSDNNRFIYLGAGGVQNFSYPTKFMRAADIVVILADPATGSPTPQYLTTHYTISGTQDATGAYPSGGTIHFLTAPDGYRVSIFGKPGIVQNTEHVDNDPLPAASIDNPLDLLTLIAQYLNDQLSRALRLPDGDPQLDMTIPPAGSRDGYLGFLNNLPVTLPGTGALPSILSSDYIYADTQFGVVADGVTDNSTKLQQAHDAAVAAGKPLILPVGTIVGCFDYDSYFKCRGAGSSLTELIAPDGANRAPMRARGAAALWGTSSNAGSHRVDLRDFSINGNRDNNSTGDCLDHYGGWPIFQNLFLTEAAEKGLRTESGAGDIDDPYDREGWISDIRIKRCGKEGYHMSGPGDSHLDNITAVDCSLLGTHLYDAIYCAGGQSNARWSKIHTYNHTTYLGVTLPRVRYGLNIVAGTNGHQFSEAYFEGSGVANVYAGGACAFDSSCIISRPFDSADGLVIAANGVNYFGSITGAVAPQNVVGIRLGIAGHTVQYCRLDCSVSTCKSGLIDFTYSGGRNFIRINGFQAEAGAVNTIGTQTATDEVYISCNTGGAIYAPIFREHGTCRLYRNSNGTLRLTPIDGGWLDVNKQYMPVVDSSNNALAATGLLINTLYYIYAYADRAVSVSALLEASTTGYTVDSAGIPRKTGDTTRSLVGMVYTSSANTKTISGAADNGAGLIRLTVNNTTSLATGMEMHVASVVGTTEANGDWPVTIVDGTHIDLQGSTFVNAYVSGGTAVTAAFLDSATTGRLVASWYKPRRLTLTDRFSTDRTTTGTSLAEINAEIGCSFVCWAGEVLVSYSGAVANATSGKIVYAAIIDENAAILAGAAATSSNANDLNNASMSQPVIFTEGKHSVTVGGYVDAGTATFYQSKPANALSVSLSI